MLSIIIPTYNEQKLGYLSKILQLLVSTVNAEIICVDSMSCDNTVGIIQQFPVTLIQTQETSRAARINIGVEKATGSTLLLHHPRTLLNLPGLAYLVRNCTSSGWGGFTQMFDINHPVLQFTSWYSNHIRLKLKGIVYLDHCLYLSQELARHIFPISTIPIFEDTVISKRLRQFSQPRLIPFPAITSAYRFIKNGIIKQAMINQILKIMYLCGRSHSLINHIYEKNLNLNNAV